MTHTRVINGTMHVWEVKDLWLLAGDLPVEERDPRALIDLECDGWFGGRVASAGEVLNHMKRILDADLDYPVILDHDNSIMDGAHRICRAILENRATIKTVKFKQTPAPSRTHSENAHEDSRT